MTSPITKQSSMPLTKPSCCQKACTFLGKSVVIALGAGGGGAVALKIAKSTAVCGGVVKYFLEESAKQPESIHKHGTMVILGISSVVTCGLSVVTVGAISGSIITYLFVRSVLRRISV